VRLELGLMFPSTIRRRPASGTSRSRDDGLNFSGKTILSPANTPLHVWVDAGSLSMSTRPNTATRSISGDRCCPVLRNPSHNDSWLSRLYQVAALGISSGKPQPCVGPTIASNLMRVQPEAPMDDPVEPVGSSDERDQRVQAMLTRLRQQLEKEQAKAR